MAASAIDEEDSHPEELTGRHDSKSSNLIGTSAFTTLTNPSSSCPPRSITTTRRNRPRDPTLLNNTNSNPTLNRPTPRNSMPRPPCPRRHRTPSLKGSPTRRRMEASLSFPMEMRRRDRGLNRRRVSMIPCLLLRTSFTFSSSFFPPADASCCGLL